MSYIQNLIHNKLWSFTEKNLERTRDLKRNGEKYLRRFYITPRRKDKHGEETGEYKGFGAYLHYFYRGDLDYELHNHPWKLAISFILCGGYLEERRTPQDTVVVRVVKPFTINIVRANDFHRIIKKPGTEHTWTLFLTFKRFQDWGFWNRNTAEYIPHESFVDIAEQGYELNKQI